MYTPLLIHRWIVSWVKNRSWTPFSTDRSNGRVDTRSYIFFFHVFFSSFLRVFILFFDIDSSIFFLFNRSEKLLNVNNPHLISCLAVLWLTEEWLISFKDWGELSRLLFFSFPFFAVLFLHRLVCFIVHPYTAFLILYECVCVCVCEK